MNNIEIKIKNKNIDRIIRKLISLNIDLLKINYIKYNEINLLVKKDDLNKISEITKYKIIKLYGIDKIKHIFKKYKIILVSITISFIFILFLSKIIFKVEVIHSDKNIRNLLIEELKEYNIKPLEFTKSYKYIEKVKKEILEKYKDKIEWLEIEKEGTKYIVKIEERKISTKKEDLSIRNIVAKKDALILKVECSNGEIIKNKNEYVKKGDTIISGSIKLNEELKKNTKAIGKVYGEVWYKVIVEYPLNYKEAKILTKEKNIYYFKIVNYKFKLNNIKNYNVKKEERIIYKNSVLPIYLIKQKTKKVEYIEQKLTKEEAINKAILKAKEEMNKKLSENEYIIDTKKLKVDENNSKIILEIFFKVYEDITDYKEIEGE